MAQARDNQIGPAQLQEMGGNRHNLSDPLEEVKESTNTNHNTGKVRNDIHSRYYLFSVELEKRARVPLFNGVDNL